LILLDQNDCDFPVEEENLESFILDEDNNGTMTEELAKALFECI